MTIPKLSLAERIAQHSRPDPVSGCHAWTASLTHGYGNLQVAGKLKKAHRIAWEVANGPIPAGMMVCHRCDNPGCVNVEHLFLGTAQDNMTDKMAKGRHRPARGSKCPWAKLTESDVAAIRCNWPPRRGDLTRLGAQYGVSPSNIGYILKNKSWRQADV